MITQAHSEEQQSTSNRFGEDPDVVLYTSHYVRRLLAESSFIYARLEHPGGSVILTSTGLIDSDRTYEYASSIGNPFHLDLIDLQKQMKRLSKKEREALIAWADGLSTLEAAQYLHASGSVVIRKRRERGIHSLTEAFNEGEDHGGTRKDSVIPSEETVPQESQGPGRGPQRETTGTDIPTRISRSPRTEGKGSSFYKGEFVP